MSNRPPGVERHVVLDESQSSSAFPVPFRRLEIAVDGTLDGCVAVGGPRAEMFTDVPAYALAQRGNHAPRQHGIARYAGAKGSGFTLFCPVDPHDWNGALFVTAHGAGSYQPVGDLRAHAPSEHVTLMGRNYYVEAMVDRGYAVAYTRRSAAMGPSDDEAATLEDGRTIGGLSFAYHVGLMRDLTGLAQHLLAERLGRRPERTYLYGHSAGASLGRLFNYVPGANRDAAGGPVFDGLLLDAAGAGYYLPQLLVDGRDVLFATPAERAAFVPQIDVVRALQFGERGEVLPVHRENTRLLHEKGLGARVRTYEIAGVSHFDAGQLLGLADHFGGAFAGALQAEDVRNLDLGGLFSALVERLDAWVRLDEPPPPSRSAALLGEQASKDEIAAAVVALPEIACPTGVYYPYPAGAPSPRIGSQVTGFAAYDGRSLEPNDAHDVLVDMNHNGLGDMRETVTQAWQRRLREGEPTGVLGPGARLTRELHARAVDDVASRLVADGFLSDAARDDYVAVAKAGGTHGAVL